MARMLPLTRQILNCLDGPLLGDRPALARAIDALLEPQVPSARDRASVAALHSLTPRARRDIETLLKAAATRQRAGRPTRG